MTLKLIRGTVQYRTDKLHQGRFSGFVVAAKNRDVFWDLRDAQIAPDSETINLESGEFQCDISSSFQLAVTQVELNGLSGACWFIRRLHGVASGRAPGWQFAQATAGRFEGIQQVLLVRRKTGSDRLRETHGDSLLAVSVLAGAKTQFHESQTT